MLGLAGCGNAPSDASAEGSASQLGKLSQFSATTLDGKTFTEKDLAKNDLTVLNFWMTGCKPCIEEMPQLAALEKKLPKNVQLATVCLMAENDEETVKAILEKAGFTGTTLLAGDGDYKALCDNVTATPTTVLVDSEGNLIGDEILGSSDDVEGTLLPVINKALKEAGKAEISLDK